MDLAQINERQVRRFALVYDPTRTLTLRNRFVSETKRRFNLITAIIKRSIVTNDCFGLRNKMLQQEAERDQFAFTRSADKVQSFLDWLDDLNDEYLLSKGVRGASVTSGPSKSSAETAWTSKYIDTAYQRGIRRGRAELRAAGADIPKFGQDAKDDTFVAFNQPVHADRVGLLYTRTFNELKGITQAMDQQISRVLSTCIAEGRGALYTADALNRTITGIGEDLSVTDQLGKFIPAERRAMMLARTEVIRAHHLATVQEYRNAGVSGVTVRAEWSTAGDGRVCPRCKGMQGKIFTLDEIESMIPSHPHCRCVALPHIDLKSD